MAHVYADLVAQYTETTGTGTYTLTTAVTNRRTFGSVLSNGDTTDYQVTGVDNSGNPAWEVGTGTYATSGTAMARTTVHASSTGSAIQWGVGAKVMTMVIAAEKLVFVTPAGHIKATGITSANGALLIGNGTDFTVSTLTGATNRVTVTNGSGTITLSGPQDIHTAASPNFAGLKVGSRTSATASETIIVSPGAGVTGASVKIGFSNSGTGDGSPNVAYFGVDGPALAGVAFFDTAAFGVAAVTPLELRTAGVTQVRVNHTAGATSYITMTGGVGVNSTIGTSVAGLTLAPASGVVRVSGASSPYVNIMDGTRTLNVGVDSANSTLSAFFNSTNGARFLGSAGSVTAISYSSAGAVSFPAVGTTASAANAYLDNTASNNLLRSTSSMRYKTDAEPIDVEIVREIGPKLLNATIWYRSLAPADRPGWSWYGMGAEMVAEIDPRLVHWTYPADAYEDVVTGTVEEDVPVLGEVEETAAGVVVEEGRAVLRTVARTVQRQIVDMLPVFTEDGQPVTDAEGQPLYHPVPRVQKVTREVTERRLKDGARLIPDGVQYERVALILSLYLADKLNAA